MRRKMGGGGGGEVKGEQKTHAYICGEFITQGPHCTCSVDPCCSKYINFAG